MKKVIVVLLFAFAVTVMAQSPISQGSVSLGGTASFSSQSYDYSSADHTTLILNPKAGYFFVDHLYAALSVNYIHWSSGNAQSDIYGMGPVIRYYFDVDKVKPFLGVGYNFMSQTITSDPGVYTTNEFIISGGMDFFVTRSLALEGSLNYSFISYKATASRLDPMKSKLFRVDVGFNYFIY